ncbi:hypothetical protein [Aurantimonas sp. Leaf443]|nr:hypothetical protein [Aurantimonas sp. Leaf443]
MIRGILKALFVGWVAKKFSQRRGGTYAASSTPVVPGSTDRRY